MFENVGSVERGHLLKRLIAKEDSSYAAKNVNTKAAIIVLMFRIKETALI